MSETNDQTAPALFVIEGEASPEEVAALTVVLQAVAASGAEGAGPAVVSEWAAHHRKVRSTYPSGPQGWRASALPR